MAKKIIADQNGSFMLQAIGCTFFLAAAAALTFSLQVYLLEDRAVDLQMNAYQLAQKELLLTQALLMEQPPNKRFLEKRVSQITLNGCPFDLQTTCHSEAQPYLKVIVRYPFRKSMHQFSLTKNICIAAKE